MLGEGRSRQRDGEEEGQLQLGCVFDSAEERVGSARLYCYRKKWYQRQKPSCEHVWQR